LSHLSEPESQYFWSNWMDVALAQWINASRLNETKSRGKYNEEVFAGYAWSSCNGRSCGRR
jgi:hypothetical protein